MKNCLLILFTAGLSALSAQETRPDAPKIFLDCQLLRLVLGVVHIRIDLFERGESEV